MPTVPAAPTAPPTVTTTDAASWARSQTSRRRIATLPAIVEEPVTPDVLKAVQAQPRGNNTTGIMDAATKPEAKAPVETPSVEVQAAVPVGETLPGEVPVTPAPTPVQGEIPPSEMSGASQEGNLAPGNAGELPTPTPSPLPLPKGESPRRK